MKEQKNILLPWDVDLLPQKKLVAGQLSCMYEAGNLRHIKCGETEILKMIYSALRDENWDTIPFKISDERIDDNEEEFFISFTAFYHQDDISYKAFFEIAGRPDNSIVFSMKGEALSSFKKNRIGLCIHHPIKECQGRKVEVHQTGGSVVQTIFPSFISPHQPFLQVQGMNWTTEDNLQAELQCEGDVFETEDHRNWTDSSYKTYSTPLSLPYPVLATKGEKIFHRVSLSVNAANKVDRLVKEVAETETKIPFPKIGYGFSEELTSTDIIHLKNIPLDHFRIELDLSVAGWSKKLQTAFNTAAGLDTQLALIVFFEMLQIDEFVRQLAVVYQRVKSIVVLQTGVDATPPDLLTEIYEKVKKRFPSILLGYGTNGHFAELNRNRPSLNSSIDFISFSLQPQVHASDTRSIFENLENQVDTLQTTGFFAPGRPVHINIKFSGRQDTEKADPRQCSWCAAIWTILSIQNLGEANSLSFYELKGGAGIIQDDGNLSPVYEALAMIREFNPVSIIKRYNKGLLSTDGLLLENKDGERLLLESGQPT